MTTLRIRNLGPGAAELNFVRSSWLRSSWEDYASGKRAKMPYEDFRAYHTTYTLKLITDHTVRVIEFEGIDEVLGYSVVDEFRKVAHYVYVKHPYRRQHLAQALLADMKYFTVGSKEGYRLAESMRMQYNPYLR